MIEEQQQEVIIQSPGQILKDARELAGFSTQDIAKKLCLKKDLIEDIEQDNYDVNISLTFIRGYLKLYAKHVGVEEIDIISAFDKLNTKKKEPAKLQSFSRKIANQANDDKLRLVTYLVITVIIALAVMWWLQQTSTQSASTSAISSSVSIDEEPVVEQDIIEQSETQGSLPVNEQTHSVDEISITDVEIEDTLAEQTNTELLAPNNSIANIVDGSKEVEALVEEGVEPLVDQIDGAIVEVVADPLVENLADPVELVFEFSGDCWMNLADATGENIAYGVKVKGRRMPVTGIPPFVVTLGAPEVVKINYAGEDLDMSFLTPGRIAKFDLPLSE